MNKESELAFEYLKHSTNLFITLSTGLIAIGVTFSKDLLGGVAKEDLDWLLYSSTSFLASIIFGMLVNMALTGTLEQKPDSVKVPQSIRNKNIAFLSGGQILTFAIALALSIVFAVKAEPKKTDVESLAVTETPVCKQDIFNKDISLPTLECFPLKQLTYYKCLIIVE